MLVDANLLLYAVDSESSFHRAAKDWLEEVLNGSRRVGFPWTILVAFLRITTHPRALRQPLTASEAWTYVSDWLSSDASWIPLATPRHAEVLGDLLARYDLRGNLVPDGDLAALALEHGLELCSSDSDFARIRELRWTNPLASAV